MTNKEIIKSKLEKEGYTIGNYSSIIDKLNKANLSKIIKEMSEETAEILLTINREYYILEMDTVDNEKDFNIKTAVKYFSQYGTIEEWLELEKLTENQYNKIVKYL